jgi:sugar phosphate isomerase/epimerase
VTGRREFVARLLGAVAAGGVVAPGAAAQALMRAALARRLGAIGLQLYSLRHLMYRDLDGTIAAVAAIGYREVELAGLHGRTPRAMRAIVDRHGLAAPSSHIAKDDIRGDWAATLDGAALLGQRFIVCPWIDERERTVDGYKRIAQEFNRAGAAARAHGIQFAYHNHDFEFTPVDGVLPYDLLLAECDPGLVRMELDVYWAVKGGKDPLAYFASHPGRFPMIHAKDMARDGSMVDVGAGTIDWRTIFAHGAQAGLVHTFVEHDDPPHPLADVRASYEYLRHLEY